MELFTTYRDCVSRLLPYLLSTHGRQMCNPDIGLILQLHANNKCTLTVSDGQLPGVCVCVCVCVCILFTKTDTSQSNSFDHSTLERKMSQIMNDFSAALCTSSQWPLWAVTRDTCLRIITFYSHVSNWV